MNGLKNHDGLMSWAAALVLGALAIGAVETRDRSVAPAVYAPLAANRSSLVVPVATMVGCRLQNTVKRRGTMDDRPALRTALYTWVPAKRTRLPGGSADTATEGERMESARELSGSSSVRAALAGGTQTSSQDKRPMLFSSYVGPGAGWLHALQPTTGTVVTCSNTIDA
jgi:hypothetical protein